MGTGATPNGGARASRGRLGDLLRASGLVDDRQIAEAIARSHRQGIRLGSSLVELGHADADQIADALARQHGVVACRDHDLRVIAPHVASIVPAAVARTHFAVPVRVVGGHTLLVAMRDPGDEDAVTDLWRRTGLSIRPVVAAEEAIAHALDHLYGPAAECPLEVPPVPETPPRTPMRARSSSVPQPTAPARPAARPRRWPAILAAGLLGVGVIVLVQRKPEIATEAVPATLTSPGLRAEVGEGWQRLREVDPVQRLGAQVASEVLVRGDLDDPEEILVLSRAHRAGVAMERWIADVSEGGLPVQSWWRCAGTTMPGCVIGLQCRPDPILYEGGATCVGHAIHDGARYPVTAWLWPTPGDGLAMVTWVVRGAVTPSDRVLAIARSVQVD